jgi:hypothetical protein
MSFEWDSKSAMRKLVSDIKVTMPLGPINVTKQLTQPHDPKTDAYRTCNNCGKHLNYHKDGKCP